MNKFRVGQEVIFTNIDSWYDSWNGTHCMITEIINNNTIKVDFLTERTWCFHKLVSMLVEPEELTPIN